MRRSLLVSLVAIVVVAFGGLGATFAAGNNPELGLDLQGGASVVLKPVTDVPDDVLNQTISIIRDRVDALGVAEPEISRQGGAVLVQLPGVRDTERALELVGQTAELRFRPVLADLPPGEDEQVPVTTTTTAPAEPTTTVAPSDTTAAATDTTVATTDTTVVATDPDASTTTTAADASTTTTVATEAVPSTEREQNAADAEVVLPSLDGDGEVVRRLRLGPAPLTGRAVSGADAEFVQQTSEWTVSVNFTDEGMAAFNEVAARCYNGADPVGCPTGRVAIELDGIVESDPRINAPTFDGAVSISGEFTEQEARDLALVLRYGALPVELEPQTTQTVSASLGEDSLRAGVAAGLVGLVLVLLFMVAYYRALGLVVLLGLCVSAALLWTIISFLGERSGLALTLAGATGIIVSIGVTIDSYVVYFERLKDEVRSGKSLRSSAERGFSAAYRTILAADLASLIGAAVLYLLTVGSVRGFAFFLGLSTLLDIVVAWFFTRPLVTLLSRRMTGGRVLGVSSGEALPAAPARAPVGASR